MARTVRNVRLTTRRRRFPSTGGDLEFLGALFDLLGSRPLNVGEEFAQLLKRQGVFNGRFLTHTSLHHLRTVKRRCRLPAVGPPPRWVSRRVTFLVHLNEIIRLAPEIFGTPAD